MENNNTVLVIQARCNSKRLYGKIRKKLGGVTMIERILQRVKKIKKIKKIIIATTKRRDDNFLVVIARKYNVSIFRGSTNDLVDRYYQAVKKLNFKHILRLPADNAIPEPSEYNRIIDYHLKSDNDFSSNILNFMENNYPGGIGVEIFTFKSLKKIWKSKKTKDEKEHLTLNYYNYTNDIKNKKNNFKIGTIKCPSNIARPDITLDVNTMNDYKYINKIYTYFNKKEKLFSIKDVINWHDKIFLKKITLQKIQSLILK